MHIKKTIECKSCKKFNSYLIEEKSSYKGIKIKCKHCGKSQVCTNQKNHFTTWEVI